MKNKNSQHVSSKEIANLGFKTGKLIPTAAILDTNGSTLLTNEEKREKPFTFRNQTLTYNLLKQFGKVKKYFEDSHVERSLVKDTQGNLYIYYFNEKVNFEGPDEITEFFFLVEDEETSEEYATKHVLELLPKFPYIYVSYNYDILVKEENTN